jgi:polygalacturonase
VGDGVTLDSPAIQRAIDAAAEHGPGARVLVRRGHRYLIGSLELRSHVDFHLEGNAELVVSTNRADYQGDGVIVATGARGLRISGTGGINGRAREFMTGFDAAGEWWVPADWRPKMFLLTACQDLVVRDITFREAPQWGLHMLGCTNVLVDRLTIRNLMDVPNCDGIDPDHCQDVEIRNCRIRCGDDAIVIKATRQTNNYGPSARILVRDCVLETQDSGLKIGTETTQDIHDIRFERCEIPVCNRAITIQLRDEGKVYNIEFADIRFVSRYFADPWWGRGEAISLTAMPRTPETRLGSVQNVRIINVRGRSENSVRVCGTAGSRIQNVVLDGVAIKFERWTRYRGGLFDNRPTTVLDPIEVHGNPGFFLRHAADITLRRCRVDWGKNAPEYFTFALEAEQTSDLKLSDFKGRAAHPRQTEAIRLH